MTRSVLIVAGPDLTKSKSWSPYLAYRKYFAMTEGDLLVILVEIICLLASMHMSWAILHEVVTLVTTPTAAPFRVDPHGLLLCIFALVEERDKVI